MWLGTEELVIFRNFAEHSIFIDSFYIRRMTQPGTTDNRQVFLKFIAYLQVIGIILVVFGHSFHEYPDGSHGTSLLIYRLCYNFRMPLFMFVSGFLMLYTTFKRNGESPAIRHFALKKVKRLLLPYLVLTLVTYIPRASMSGIADDPLPLSARGMLESLYLTDRLPIPFFWFIQASFLLLIFNYVIISLCRRNKVPMTLTFVGIIALFVGAQFVEWGSTEIFGYHYAINLGIYFVLGAAYCEFYPKVDRYLPLDNWSSLIISFIIWISTFMLWEGTELSRISSMFGIAMCISLAKLFVRYKVSFLDHLVGANYLIFLLSWYFNVLTQQVLAHFVDQPWWVHTVLSLIFGIYIPWIGYIYLRNNRHRKVIRTISTLLGQSFRK